MAVFITRIAELTYKYRSGTISPEEKAELDQILNESEEMRAWFNKINDGNYTMEQLRIMQQIDVADGWRRFQAARKTEEVKRKPRLLGVAASLLLVVMAGCLYYIFSGSRSRKMDILVPFEKSGSALAVNGLLRFADSSVIVLDTAPDTLLARINGVVIARSKDTIFCRAGNKPHGHPEELRLQSLSKKVYMLVLPDNSRVWLNARSTITFPAWFDANCRTVNFEGEGYFEIAENANAPFHINVENKTVQVLGTKFNITAYPGDSLFNTTLLEGKLQVKVADTVLEVMPGERVVVKNSGEIAQEKVPDQHMLLAWKEGFFDFKNDKLTDILPEIARWYNLGLVYHVDPDDTKYSGALLRNELPQTILKRIQSQAPYQLILHNDTIHVRP